MEEPISKPCVCVTSDLDLWSEPPVQLGIQYAHDVEHNLTTSIDNQDVIEFFISGSGEEYTDLNNSHLRIRGKIIKSNGEDITAGAEVAPINNILHSAFSQVDVILNDVLVSPSNNLYAYKAYIEDILSHGYEAEQSHLTAAMYFKETPGEHATAGNANKSFKKRKELCAESKIFECEGRLHTELCHQLKPIINGVDIRIRLVRSSSRFALMKASTETPDYLLKITEATFIVRRLKLTNQLRDMHITELEKAPAVYHIKRVSMKAATV